MAKNGNKDKSEIIPANPSNASSVSSTWQSLSEAEMTIKGKTSDGNTVRFNAKKLPSGGNIQNSTSLPPVDKKKDRKPDIDKLLKDGHSQQEVAEITGMSQGYVSQVHNSGKKKNKKKKKK